MRIQNKIFAASLLASFMLVGSMLVLVRWSIDRGMLSYVNDRQAAAMDRVALSLTAHYEEYGGWQHLKSSPFEFHQIIRQQAGEFAIGLGPPMPPLPKRAIGSRTLQEAGSRFYRPPPPPTGQHGGPANRHLSEIPPDRKHQRPRRSQSSFTHGSDAKGVYNHRSGRPAHPKHPPNDSFVLSDANNQVLVGNFDPAIEYLKHSIESGEKTIGYLFYKEMSQITDGFELTFIEQQRQTFLLIACLVLFFSSVLSLPLSRHLVEPMRQLARQARALTQGDYEQKPSIDRGDEIGSLSDDFDTLRRTLRQNETMRHRWVADTSHELRTPVALLQAQIEAMQDGVRPIDKTNIDSMHKEVLRLTTLINDLQQLSVSDLGSLQYQMQTVNLSELLSDLVGRHSESFKHQDLRLHTAFDAGARIRGDVTRLQQLFDNLLNNSLKYTDSGGVVRVALRRHGNGFNIVIADSSPGVSEAQLNHLFDYLYRAESSRNRETGGSGLGLAICQRIVEAHQGRINVAHAKEGGLEVSLFLPAHN